MPQPRTTTKTFIAEISEYVYAGANIGVMTSGKVSDKVNQARILGFTTTTGTPANRYLLKSHASGSWNVAAQDKTFNAIGQTPSNLKKVQIIQANWCRW